MEITITAISVLVGIIALIITSYFQIKTNRMDGLMRAFNKLNDSSHRNKRRLIFQKYLDSINETKIVITIDNINKKEFRFDPKNRLNNPSDNELRQAIEEVRADYDEIGVMMNQNLLPKKPFMAVYWASVIRAWYALYGNSEFMKKDLLPEGKGYFMIFFEELFNEAVKYWKNNPDTKERKVEIYK